MSDSLFIIHAHKNACLLLLLLLLLRWLINGDDHDYIMMMYLLYNMDYYFECSRSG
jgi:hypothetical protein